MKFQVCQWFSTVVNDSSEFDGERHEGYYPVGEVHESIGEALTALLALKARTEIGPRLLGRSREEAPLTDREKSERGIYHEEEGRETTVYGGYIIQPSDEVGRNRERAYRKA
jgi:hypothetical protein